MVYLEKESIDVYGEMFKNDWEEYGCGVYDSKVIKELVPVSVLGNMQDEYQYHYNKEINTYTGSKRVTCSLWNLARENLYEVTLYSGSIVVDIVYVRGYEEVELKEEKVSTYIKKYIEGVDFSNYDTIEDVVLMMLLKVDNIVFNVVTYEDKKRFKTNIE